MHGQLCIISIKYLLSSKSLFQSLNLVHLQFLEQRADLRGKKKQVDKRNKRWRIKKKTTHKYMKKFATVTPAWA